MKKTLTVLILFLTALVCNAQGSKVVTDSIESDVLGVTKEFTVYLPDGYDNSEVDYPVLYLLHGAWGDHTDWTRQGNAKNIADVLYASGFATPAIIVMPDASGEKPDRTGYRMGYFDKPEWRYETHFFDEFIPYVEGKYRIRAEKEGRAIAGLSMGGGGSMVYALHRPDMFSSCCPLSGLLGMHGAVNDDQFIKSISVNDPQAILRGADDPQLGEFRTVRWYIDCGDDDFLARLNVEMFLLMKEKEIPFEYRMRDGGHTWEYWQSALPSVLQFISTGFVR